MKRTYLWIAVSVIFLLGFFIFKGLLSINKANSMTIIYPSNLTVFPKDMAIPDFVWKDDNPDVRKWYITVKTGKSTIINKLEVSEKLGSQPASSLLRKIIN